MQLHGHLFLKILINTADFVVPSSGWKEHQHLAILTALKVQRSVLTSASTVLNMTPTASSVCGLKYNGCLMVISPDYSLMCS